MRAGPLLFEFGSRPYANGLWRRSFDRHIAWPLPDANADRTRQAFQMNMVSKQVKFAGFNWVTGEGPGFEYAPITAFKIPWWFLTTLSAVLPLVWIWKKLRRLARYREGLCERCGYDLRATPDRCPECGHIPTKVSVLGSVSD
jgi:hypothetical protein